MDFLNNLLTNAAGYFGAEQKRKADLELARLGLASTTPAPVTTSAPVTMSEQWIPGVSNGVVIAGGAILVVGGLLIALRK